MTIYCISKPYNNPNQTSISIHFILESVSLTLTVSEQECSLSTHHNPQFYAR